MGKKYGMVQRRVHPSTGRGNGEDDGYDCIKTKKYPRRGTSVGDDGHAHYYGYGDILALDEI